MPELGEATLNANVAAKTYWIVVFDDPEFTMVKGDRIDLDEGLVNLGNRTRHLDKLGIVVFDAGVGLFEDHGSRHGEGVRGC